MMGISKMTRITPHSKEVFTIYKKSKFLWSLSQGRGGEEGLCAGCRARGTIVRPKNDIFCLYNIGSQTAEMLLLQSNNLFSNMITGKVTKRNACSRCICSIFDRN
jgi:hypothetical protein